jgi:hypothetical protein
MADITFTAKVKFTEEQVIAFATAKGWNEQSNITAQEFVKEVIKFKMIWFVGQPTKEAIKLKHEENKQNELLQYKEELSSKITIE